MAKIKSARHAEDCTAAVSAISEKTKEQSYVEKIVSMTINCIKEKTDSRTYFEEPVLVNRGSVRKI